MEKIEKDEMVTDYAKWDSFCDEDEDDDAVLEEERIEEEKRIEQAWSLMSRDAKSHQQEGRNAEAKRMFQMILEQGWRDSDRQG